MEVVGNAFALFLFLLLFAPISAGGKSENKTFIAAAVAFRH